MIEKVRPAMRRKRIFLIIALIAVAAWGIGSRIEAAAALRQHTENQAVATVVVMKAARGPANEEIVLPGTVEAWHEAPIYARTNGYIKRWVTDIGAKVKAGDLLAEIETPEIDSQLRQAEADLATADANNALAQSTATRWRTLRKTDSVSQQDADEKIGAAAAAAATLASARANRDRLRDLESFKHVTAPFDGTITARNTDTGALINAGSGTAQGPELFHIAQVDKLRVYVQVPENDAAAITPNLEADLRFAEYPGRNFPATLSNTASALDPTARTLLVEFTVDNQKGELLPGGYTEAHLKLAARADNIRLPVNTLLFRSDGMQVATVDGNSHVLLKSVTIGRDFGNEVEITSGIAPDEAVVVNPPDSLISGQTVRIAEPAAAEEKADDKKKDDKKP